MEGKFRKNEIGRWEIVDGSGKRVEITSGEVIEVRLSDQSLMGWIPTRVEHNGDDYYATVPGLRLYSGMPARDRAD